MSSTTNKPQTSGVEERRRHRYQQNPWVGWTYMLAYWAVGATIGQMYGYANCWTMRSLLSDPTSPWFWPAFCVCASITALCQFMCSGQHVSNGRSLDWAAIGIYGFFNSVFETYLYLFTYDIGKFFVLNTLGLADRPGLAYISGLTVVFHYLGFVHAVFWIRFVLPLQKNFDAKPWVTHALPFLTSMAVAWMGFYEVFGAACGIPAIVAFHFIYDIWGAYDIRFETPLRAAKKEKAV